MALDPAISDQLTTLILTGAQGGADISRIIGQNLAQGLGVIQGAVIQAQASNSDDPAVIAALQTASRSPQGEKTGA
jgi:hypothetical protein